jgi:hypothetical protein
MRVLVRRQQVIRSHFDPCGCATYQATERLNDIVEGIRDARRGTTMMPSTPGSEAHVAGQEELQWGIARALFERVPDLIGLMDRLCNIDASKFNREIEDSIRAKDFNRLVEAVAGVKLRLCGTEVPEGGVVITPEQIAEMVAQTEREIKTVEGLR